IRLHKLGLGYHIYSFHTTTDLRQKTSLVDRSIMPETTAVTQMELVHHGVTPQIALSDMNCVMYHAVKNFHKNSNVIFELCEQRKDAFIYLYDLHDRTQKLSSQSSDCKAKQWINIITRT
ncbi:hypothetical protein CHS0354_030557, partial [Potamilus streckersoni]